MFFATIFKVSNKLKKYNFGRSPICINGFDFYSPVNLKSYNLNETIRYQLNILSTLDAFTRRHCENVANITLKLCQKLHLNKKFTIYCTICAYLHDIGKAFIPPAILQKQAKLTDEEYEIMKTHTTIGYKMCLKDKELAPYTAGPLYHHEGMDGSGYPNGITDVPIEAQIIRVADEYDAIVSKRQYKSHIDISDTLKILASKTKPTPDDPKVKIPTNTKMNPKIVRALMKVVKIDIEYEISCVYDYIDHLKQEIKRLEEVKIWHTKMNKCKSETNKEYYLYNITHTLEKGETLENFSQILDEYKHAYEMRQQHLDKLYDEIKKISKIEC